MIRTLYKKLRSYSVSVISVVLTEMDPSLKNLKEDFQSTTTTGFGETSSEELKKVNRWELKPAQIDEWKVRDSFLRWYKKLDLAGMVE